MFTAIKLFAVAVIYQNYKKRVVCYFKSKKDERTL